MAPSSSWYLKAGLLITFLCIVLNLLLEGSEKVSVAVFKFVLPEEDGYVARCDSLERRMAGFEFGRKTQSFLSPRDELKSTVFPAPSSADDLVSLFSQAIGAIHLHVQSKSQAKVSLSSAEKELENRISFPWLSRNPIAPKRLVWVEGCPDFEFSRRMYEAAWALGITLVIIDKPGHWLQDAEESYAYLREAFIPVNISVDEGFVGRIVAAVTGYDKPVDGIISVSDARVVGIAKACEILGLPTSPSAAYILAADKYKTHLTEPDDGGAFQVNSLEDLKAQLASNSDSKLEYPLIVKPCMGWGSECISKVSNEEELLQAAEKASARHAESPQLRTEVMIESYIEGPEIDANFVLIDGEILFYEIADDFPSPGDSSTATWSDNFQETANLLLTGLPQNEAFIIRDSIHQSLLRQGFLSGTFHCEGRVRYSSMHYKTLNNREDLYPNQPTNTSQRQPVFYLHEINARPAGYLESVATHLTYGVDQYALQLLYSLNDISRYRSLSQPFLKGPQWWLVLLIIPEERSGIMKSEDAGNELLERDAVLKAAVPDNKTVQKRGGILGGPQASSLSYLAYFSVISRKGRLEALELADGIRKGFVYELVGDEATSTIE